MAGDSAGNVNLYGLADVTEKMDSLKVDHLRNGIVEWK